MFRGGDYVDNPKFYTNDGTIIKNSLDVSVSIYTQCIWIIIAFTGCPISSILYKIVLYITEMFLIWILACRTSQVERRRTPLLADLPGTSWVSQTSMACKNHLCMHHLMHPSRSTHRLADRIT